MLGHAHDGVIYRRIAVRMVFTNDVTDHAGGFLVGLVPVVAEYIHRVEHTAMNRFQTVTDVRKRAPDNDAHGIVQVGLSHLVFEVYLQHFFGEFSHIGNVLRNTRKLIVL